MIAGFRENAASALRGRVGAMRDLLPLVQPEHRRQVEDGMRKAQAALAALERHTEQRQEPAPPRLRLVRSSTVSSLQDARR